MFRLPRRGREPFDESRPQIRHFFELENAIMAALENAVAELRSAIENANTRFQNVGEFESKLAEERARYDALVASEDVEDVQQNQELTDAKAATDAALAELQDAADTLSGLTEQVNTLGTVAAEVETPTDEAPAPAEAPADAAPTEEPAPADAPVNAPVPAEDVPAAAAPVPASGGSSDPTSTENMKPNV